MTRVTFAQINGHVQDNISRNSSKMSKMQEQLSSGKRLQRPSDDPVDVTSNLQLRSDIQKLEQFKRNMEDGSSYLAVVEDTLSSTNSLYQRARELALQAANDTNTGAERQYIKAEVGVVLDSLISTSNQRFKGDYIFSGTNTQSPPFTLEAGTNQISNPALVLNAPMQIIDETITSPPPVGGNPNASNIIPGRLSINALTEGTDYTVNYVSGEVTFLTAAAQVQAAGAGIDITFDWIKRSDKDLDGTIYREIDSGVTSQINTTASEVFGGVNDVTTWDAFIGLMEGLHKDQQTTISQSIGGIDDAFKRALTAQSSTGARGARLDFTEIRNDEAIIETTRLHSVLEDVDFTKLISDFLLAETVYSASLQSGARVIQPTLANFL